jgi:hypothetical protein
MRRFLAFFPLVAAVFAAEPAPVGFPQPRQITIPGATGLFLSADLNGDGYSDLALSSSGGMTLLLSDGHGGYQAPVSITLPGQVLTIVAGDFNGDGIPDLVASVDNIKGQSGAMMLLPGLGAGRFGTPVSIWPAAFALIVTGDFNGDGLPDLAVAGANGKGQTVKILLGNGSGGLQAAGTWSNKNYSPIALYTADFNGDGVPDLLLLQELNDYPGTSDGAVLLGDGHGNLLGGGGIGAGGYIYPNVAVGDVNGDGLADILVPMPDRYGVQVFLSNGDGTFRLGQLRTAVSPIGEIALLDTNGAGKPDLAAFTYDDTLILMEGNGDGTFGSGAPHMGGAAGGVPLVLQSPAGVDGIAAVGASDLSHQDLSVFIFGLKNGGFDAPRLLDTSFAPYATVTADFNHDGKLDLATSAPPGMAVLLGNGDGTFQAPQVQAGFPGYYPLAVADLNGDGIPDVVVSHLGGPFALAVFLGNGDGTFHPLGTQPVVTYDGWAGIADVNGDGIPDIVTAWLGVSAPVMVYLGKGDGTFGLPIAQSFALSGPAVFADFNGDGKMDMALNDEGSHGYVALGNGDGTFQSPVKVDGVNCPAAAADLNGDGIPDLVGYSATSKQSYLAVALGHGDGTFGQAILHPLQYGFDPASSTVVITDWNGDGHADIAAMPGPYAGYTQFLLGDGTGTFALQENGFFLDAQSFPAVGDFNGDGLPDVASASGAIWVLVNTAQ